VTALRKAAKKYNFDVNSVIGNFDSWTPVLNSNNNRTVGQVIAARTARGYGLIKKERKMKYFTKRFINKS
jgi:hypothetical protein